MLSSAALAGTSTPMSELFRLIRPVGRMESTVIISYADESHDEKSERTYAVAGIFGHDQPLLQLELLWQTRTHELKEPFHYADCECGHGQFANWTKEDCRTLIADLISYIEKLDVFAFGCTVSIPDFRELFPGEDHEEMYFLAFRHCVLAISKMADDGADGKMNFVFDQRKEFEHRAHALYRRVKSLPGLHQRWMGTLAFSSRAKIVPLQAADVVAREAFKCVDNATFSPQFTRKSLQRIAKTRKFAIEHYGRPALEVIASEMSKHEYKTLNDYLMISDVEA